MRSIYGTGETYVNYRKTITPIQFNMGTPTKRVEKKTKHLGTYLEEIAKSTPGATQR